MCRLYTWNELCERAMNSGYGDIELKAKDNARDYLYDIIIAEEGYDIDKCNCPEDEIDGFNKRSDKNYLFDNTGHLIKQEVK